MNTTPCEDTQFLLAWASCPAFGARRLMDIYEAFGSFEVAYEASGDELRSAGMEERLVKLWLEQRQNFDIEQSLKALRGNGISLLDFRDERYPLLLKETHGPPPLLYYRGTLPPADGLCVAVVGSRRITNYGKTVLPEICEPLIKHGIIIVSGLAFGVDGLAHQLAVDNRSPTIAVLGTGVDDAGIYPKEHGPLAQQILETGGLLLSEFPPGMPGLKQNFVLRNRIVAGLCAGTVVAEAAAHSGALITAQIALDEDRTVYAVPGPIFSEMSAGPNNLLKIGAKPVTSAADILQDLNIAVVADMKDHSLTDFAPTERVVLKKLTHEPTALDVLIKESLLDAKTVTATLTYLEMKGAVRHLGGQLYTLAISIRD